MADDQLAPFLPNLGQLADEFLTPEQMEAFKRFNNATQDYAEGLMRQIWAHERDDFRITADQVRAELEGLFEFGMATRH